jgi:hypothetical protein
MGDRDHIYKGPKVIPQLIKKDNQKGGEKKIKI